MLINGNMRNIWHKIYVPVIYITLSLTGNPN